MLLLRTQLPSAMSPEAIAVKIRWSHTHWLFHTLAGQRCVFVLPTAHWLELVTWSVSPPPGGAGLGSKLTVVSDPSSRFSLQTSFFILSLGSYQSPPLP